MTFLNTGKNTLLMNTPLRKLKKRQYHYRYWTSTISDVNRRCIKDITVPIITGPLKSQFFGQVSLLESSEKSKQHSETH